MEKKKSVLGWKCDAVCDVQIMRRRIRRRRFKERGTAVFELGMVFACRKRGSSVASELSSVDKLWLSGRQRWLCREGGWNGGMEERRHGRREGRSDGTGGLGQSVGG